MAKLSHSSGTCGVNMDYPPQSGRSKHFKGPPSVPPSTAKPAPRRSTDLESRTTSSGKVFVRGRRRGGRRWLPRRRRQRRTCRQGAANVRREAEKRADAELSLRLFSPFFKQHRPAGEKLWISRKKKDGEESEKDGDGALRKTERQRRKRAA